MGVNKGRNVIFILLFAVGLVSFPSYAEGQGEEVVVELGSITAEQGLPGGEGQQWALQTERQAILKPDIGIKKTSNAESKAEAEESCGMFEVTGYCACEICTGDYKLTYSETIPKSERTVAADLHVFPLGTRLKIDGIIYTVEDTGASIKGNKIDIFYNTHQEALESGRRFIEVFRVGDTE